MEGRYEKAIHRRTIDRHILKEAEAGMKVAELCRKYGISDATLYNWKGKCLIVAGFLGKPVFAF